MGIACSVACFMTFFDKNKILRVAIFFSTSIFGIVPYCHAMYLLYSGKDEWLPLYYTLPVQGLLYTLGVIVYLKRFPEKQLSVRANV